MTNLRQISRSTFYYEEKEQPLEEELSQSNVDIFHKNRKAYGTRKIKCKIKKIGLTTSRCKIGHFMSVRCKIDGVIQEENI